MSTIKTTELECRIQYLEQDFEDMEMLIREMLAMINELSGMTPEIPEIQSSGKSAPTLDQRVAQLEKEFERMRRVSMVVLENLNNLTEASVNESSKNKKGDLHVVK